MKIMLKQTPIKIAIKIKPSLSQTFYNIEHGTSNQIKCTFKSNKRNIEAIEANVNCIHDANSKNKQRTAFRNLQVSDLVEKFCKGYNATVIAYGQTGSGKTYLMDGSDEIRKSNRQKGLIQQAVQKIYKQKSVNCVISCSFVQIYNQNIYDLLSYDKRQNPLRLRWQPQKQFVLQDSQPKVCQNYSQMLQWYGKGKHNRIVASNRVNELSSRSHCLFTIFLEDVDGQGYYRSRQLTFVDLAGSERLTDGQSKISKQSIQINKSLFFLRKVVKQLQQQIQIKKSERNYCRDDKRQSFIPYRNSKLTSLLKRSLGGNCVTLMVACISPQQGNFEQTLSSLSYIISAGKIRNQASIQYDKKSGEIKYLKEYNAKLKKQLEISRRQIDSFQFLFKKQHSQQSNQLNSQLVQCISTVRQLLQTTKQLREELESQKLNNKRYLSEIAQLVRINRDYKNLMRSQSIQILNEKKKQRMHSVQLKNRQVLKNQEPVSYKYQTKSSPYLLSPSKTQLTNSFYQSDSFNKTQSFRSAAKFIRKRKLRQSIFPRQQQKSIEQLNSLNIKLNPLKSQKKAQL